MAYLAAHGGAAERLIDRQGIAAIGEIAIAVVPMADLGLIATGRDNFMAYLGLSLK